MTSHRDRALTLLTTAELIRAELNDVYRYDRPDRDEVGRLNSMLKHARETAGVHATLAQVEALYDLRSEVSILFDELTQDPDPLAAELLIARTAQFRPTLVTDEPS